MLYIHVTSLHHYFITTQTSTSMSDDSAREGEAAPANQGNQGMGSETRENGRAGIQDGKVEEG